MRIDPPELRRRALLGCGALAALLGLLALIGWHLHLPLLMKVHPGFVAMRYNTALCFLVSGAAVAALGSGRRRAAQLLALLPLAAGLASLVEHLGGLDLRIDQLLMRDFDPLGTTSPGRMAPNTALCFLLFGLALLSAGRAQGSRLRGPLLALAASALAVLGSLSIFGYLSGITELSGWGRFAYMAVHTAVGFGLLGAALFLFAWDDQRAPGGGSPAWLPVPVAVGVLIASLVIRQTLRTQGLVQVDRALQAEAAAFAEQVGTGYLSREQGLVRMARRWDLIGREQDREAWRADAALYISRQRGYRALLWVDPGLKARWAVMAEGEPSEEGADEAADPVLRRLFASAQASGKPELGPAMALRDGRPGAAICLPLLRGGRPDGFLVAIMDLQVWLDGFQKGERGRHFAWQLEDDRGNLFYDQTEGLDAQLRSLAIGRDLELGGRRWTLRAFPTAQLVGEGSSRVPAMVLLFGGSLALFVALLIRMAQIAWEQSRALAGANAALQGEVAERARAEEAIRASEQRLRSVTRSAQDAILALDPEGLVVSWNPAAGVLFGYEEAEVLGRPVSLLLRGEAWARTWQALRQGVEGPSGETPAHGRLVEAEGLRRDGGAVPVELTLSGWKTHEGRFFTCVVRDITERRRAERIKNEFISTVSHELRTPLTSIRGALGLVRSGALGALPEASRPMVEMAENNCLRLVALVNDILDLEKLAAGRMGLARDPLDLGQAMAASLDAIRGLEEAYGVRFEAAPAPGPAPVRGDASRLQQVLANLLSNAAKFSPEKGTVRVGLFLLGERARIEVADDGPGIPDDFRGRIFEPFSQADGSNTRPGGTGLGLSISRSLVKAMGGEIGFRSEAGRGSTFYVELPLDRG